MKKKFLASMLATAIICNGSVVAFANENENINTVPYNSAEALDSSKEDSKEKKESNKTEVSKEEKDSNKTEVPKEEKDSNKTEVPKEEIKSKETESSKSTVESTKINNTKEVQASQVKETSKSKEVKEVVEDNRDQETVVQLGYAIQEMTDAINLLDNADFTNQENHDRMTAYATAALNRVRGFEGENISVDMVIHIEWIEESGDEIRSANYSILRLLTAINNVKTVFNGENETLENKKNVLNTLNEVISQEAESYGLNEKTLNSAKNILNSYAEQLKEEEKPEDNRDQETVIQLGYAIEEMRIALDLLDNADFTVQSNYERMISFATAALDRVRGFQEENISQDMITHIEWIEKSGDEIRNETYRLNRIITAITNVETVFSPDRKDTVENMKIVLNILNTIINEEEEAGYVNEATLTSAKNILAYYWSIIPATPGDPDDNVEVEPPVGDGSGDDNMEVEPPVGDGSGDDNMEVQPPVGDGSEDDNIEVQPPVGDGSGDDNMEVQPPVGDGSDNNNNTSKPETKPTLPQTGAATVSLMGLGIASTLAGSFLRKRK